MRFGIGFISCRIRRVGLGQRFLDFVNHRLGVHRIKPDMRVGLAVAMIIMVIMAVVIMLMLVMIVFAMVVMAVVIMLMLIMIALPPWSSWPWSSCLCSS